jgi:hypothetical protein
VKLRRGPPPGEVKREDPERGEQHARADLPGDPGMFERPSGYRDLEADHEPDSGRGNRFLAAEPDHDVVDEPYPGADIIG